MDRSCRGARQSARNLWVIHHEGHHVRTEPVTNNLFSDGGPVVLIRVKSHGLEHDASESDDLAGVEYSCCSSFHRNILARHVTSRRLLLLLANRSKERG